MRARLKRLRADFEHIQTLVAGNPYIDLLDVVGSPPEKYTFEYRIRGLSPTKEGEYEVIEMHRTEVFLLKDYPRRPPFCRMITPVFHPNIDPQKICIGDHWSAGESLSNIVIRIGEMIAYQSYNLKSPLNAKAAVWVESHFELIPIHSGNLSIGL